VYRSRGGIAHVIASSEHRQWTGVAVSSSRIGGKYQRQRRKSGLRSSLAQHRQSLAAGSSRSSRKRTLFIFLTR